MSDLSELLASLARTPRFSDPACRGSDLFDPQRDGELRPALLDRRASALEVCRGCRSRAECEEWFISLDREERPVIGSVVAGRVVGEVEVDGGARLAKQARIEAMIAQYPDLSHFALGRLAAVDPKTIKTFRDRLSTAV
jgi:hypothetical protein